MVPILRGALMMAARLSPKIAMGLANASKGTKFAIFLGELGLNVAAFSGVVEFVNYIKGKISKPNLTPDTMTVENFQDAYFAIKKDNIIDPEEVKQLPQFIALYKDLELTKSSWGAPGTQEYIRNESAYKTLGEFLDWASTAETKGGNTAEKVDNLLRDVPVAANLQSAAVDAARVQSGTNLIALGARASRLPAILPGSLLSLTQGAVVSERFKNFVEYSDAPDVRDDIIYTLQSKPTLTYFEALNLIYGIYAKLGQYVREAALDVATIANSASVTQVTPYDAWRDFI